jgi:hypothetical protein
MKALAALQRYQKKIAASLIAVMLLAMMAAAQRPAADPAQPTQDPPGPRAATTQPNRAHPAPDSHALYTSFFFFVEDFAKWTDARVEAANPGDQARILNSSAKLFGITAADFAQLKIIANQSTANLRAVGDQAHAYVESVKGDRSVNHAVLASFHNQREQIVQSGVDQLKTSLSPSGWEALHRYINNQHRQHVFLSVSQPTPSVPQATAPR